MYKKCYHKKLKMIFDVEPLMGTKKIKGTHLIHPKVHMGVNTIQNSLKNGTHDIRGDYTKSKNEYLSME